MERGGLAIIVGRAPTSLVIDPPDGRIPPLTAEAQARLRQRTGSRGRFDSHADLSLSERCLRSASGPPYFTAPWTVRLPMTRTGEELFEFACHEGNYSLPNILRGARFEERASTTAR